MFDNGAVRFGDWLGRSDRPLDRASFYAEDFEYFGKVLIIAPNEGMVSSDAPRFLPSEKDAVPVIEVSGAKYRALLHSDAQRAK